MKKNKDISNLGYLGNEGQIKIVKALIENEDFFLSVFNELDQNAFSGADSAKLREIVGVMKDLYSKKNITPNYASIELELRERSHTDIDLEESIATIDMLKGDSLLIGMEQAKEIALRFFKQQKLIKTLQKGLKSVENNGYDGSIVTDINEQLQKIYKDAPSNNDNEDIYSMFHGVINRRSDEKVNFGIEAIDDAMNGGMCKGQLALLIAKTGAGKTTLSTIIANHSARCGNKVMQIFFEEGREEIAAKHYACMSGMYTNTITKNDKEKIWHAINDKEYKDAIKNNLKLIKMETESTQVGDIKNKILSMRNNYGFNPDLVIIDYFSCLQKSSNKNNDYNNEWKAAENCMRKIERMAEELNIAILVCEQTNRNGAKKDTSDDRVANIQGSYRATQPCSFIFYLDRTNCEMNRANLYMDKSRNCEPKEWENITLNNGNLHIEMNEGTSFNPNLAWGEKITDNECVKNPDGGYTIFGHRKH